MSSFTSGIVRENEPTEAGTADSLRLDSGGEADEIARHKLSENVHQSWLRCRTAAESGDKEVIRNFHLAAKQWDKSVDYSALRLKLKKYRNYFPSGGLIDPGKIDPELVLVGPRSLEEDLFKVTRGYWSMPYSKGYGRRLRFLVIDRYHEAVIGIIGLQSPSADLSCRDKYLGVAKNKKLEIVNNTLDAYTIGASPVYASLLGGKLVAGFLHSTVIRQSYWRSYGRKMTTQLNQRVHQPLLAITTASAFGRSSIYNRLRDGHGALAKSLGYTKGYGTIHLEELYPQLVSWLKSIGRHVPAGFGNGPKVRWQNIVRALLELELPREYLSHGICREVFIFELVNNLREVCQHGVTPDIKAFDDSEWSEYWRERWCLPRALRDERWKNVDSYQLMDEALKDSARSAIS
ncbi:DUF4338 domain-containing protein [Pseudomonas sp. GD03721]|nr:MULTISPECIES: Druantia anti-phage system protein DruA [Pseudomonas]MDH1442965.1 DUF4338 domain-containing protein [Pseudomonas sp. GD03722]MDV5859859.1 DUF4338 domain-containing protein [Pseudomonas mendocina]WGG02221.1 DUF4338 domain-containing protein [Pseudomonas sp. GD03721]WGG06390.1 DUF4338 domain-containing protein [Pseudomonas sp. GD03919]